MKAQNPTAYQLVRLFTGKTLKDRQFNILNEASPAETAAHFYATVWTLSKPTTNVNWYQQQNQIPTRN